MGKISVFHLNPMNLEFKQDILKKIHKINEASWEKQEKYERKDFRWSFYCTIGTYVNWIGNIRPKVLIDAYNQVIDSGNYISAVFISRAIMESYASLFYLRRLLDNLNEILGNSVKSKHLIESIDLIIQGVRYPTKFPWGKEIENLSINIITMIKKLNREQPTAEEDYNFLSNFCHPNFYPSVYILSSHPVFAGIPSGPMKKWQVETSNRINKTQSYVLKGIKKEINLILDYCINNLIKIKKIG